MKKYIRQFIAVLRRSRLSDGEREAMRRDMRAFVGARHARAADRVVRVSAFSRRISQIFFININRPMIATLAVIITLVFGGGVSAAAENAVPGDLLYPVKVKVNEEIRASIALNPEAKARVAANRVERRLEEIAVLANKGELKEETRAMIEAKIAMHTAEVNTQLAASADASEAIQVRAEIEAVIKAKEKLLKKAHGKYAVRVTIGSVIDAFIASTTPVVFSTSTTSTPPMTASSTPTTTLFSHAARGKMKAAAQKIQEVKRFISRAREKYGADAVLRAEAHLQAAQTVFMGGTAALEKGDDREAFRLFQEAHTKAQEAKLLVEFRNKFHMDIDLGSGTTTASTTAGILIDAQRKEDREEQEERKDRREEFKEELKDAREEWKKTTKEIKSIMRAL